MDDVTRSGRTVIFVSHNMSPVRGLTARCILIKGGKVLFDGPSREAVQKPSKAGVSTFEPGSDLSRWPRAMPDLDRRVEFAALGLGGRPALFEPDETILVEVSVNARVGSPSIRVSCTLFGAEGTPVGSFFSSHDIRVDAGEMRDLRVWLRGSRLAPGRYSFGLSLTKGNEKEGYHHHDALLNVLPFEVSAISGDSGTLGSWPQHWAPIRFPEPEMEGVQAPFKSVHLPVNRDR